MRFIIDMYSELWQHRTLLFALVQRDLRVRYKQSVLGIAWALLAPVAMMLIFTAITKAGVLRVETGGIPYAVFAYCGILPWTLLSSALVSATGSLVANHNLLTKIYFPRAVFPLAAILSKLVDFVIALSVLAMLMLHYRIPLNNTLLALPLLLGAQLLFMAGVSYLLAMGNLFYRDVKYLVDTGMLLWMFLTSVLYPIRFTNPALQALLALNPMTPIIDGYRACIIHGRWPDSAAMAPAILVSAVVFLAGSVCFHRKEFEFAERV